MGLYGISDNFWVSPPSVGNNPYICLVADFNGICKTASKKSESDADQGKVKERFSKNLDTFFELGDIFLLTLKDKYMFGGRF